jgi:hypothetical protein
MHHTGCEHQTQFGVAERRQGQGGGRPPRRREMESSLYGRPNSKKCIAWSGLRARRRQAGGRDGDDLGEPAPDPGRR